MTGTLEKDPIINHKKNALIVCKAAKTTKKPDIQENQVTNSSQHNFLHQHKMTISYFVVEIYFEWFNEYIIKRTKIFLVNKFCGDIPQKLLPQCIWQAGNRGRACSFPLISFGEGGNCGA